MKVLTDRQLDCWGVLVRAGKPVTAAEVAAGAICTPGEAYRALEAMSRLGGCVKRSGWRSAKPGVARGWLYEPAE